MSLDLLEYIVDKHSIDMDSRLLKQTQDIIGSGKASQHYDYSERPFLLQVSCKEGRRGRGGGRGREGGERGGEGREGGRATQGGV